MRNNGIELDWVMVLTMENDGFIAIPIIAEYCIPHPDSGQNLVGMIQVTGDLMIGLI